MTLEYTLIENPLTAFIPHLLHERDNYHYTPPLERNLEHRQVCASIGHVAMVYRPNASNRSLPPTFFTSLEGLPKTGSDECWRRTIFLGIVCRSSYIPEQSSRRHHDRLMLVQTQGVVQMRNTTGGIVEELDELELARPDLQSVEVGCIRERTFGVLPVLRVVRNREEEILRHYERAYGDIESKLSEAREREKNMRLLGLNDDAEEAHKQHIQARRKLVDAIQLDLQQRSYHYVGRALNMADPDAMIEVELRRPPAHILF